MSFLTLAMNRLVDQSTTLVPWITQLEAGAYTFNRQALPMVWDYVEASPTSYYYSALDWTIRVLAHLTQIPPVEATEEPLP